MDEKIEKGKNFLDFLSKNKFVYTVIYYSILAWFYFFKQGNYNYKYLVDTKKFLTEYNDMILFVSIVCFIVVKFIRITFDDHMIGIEADGNNTKAVERLTNAYKLEDIGQVLFITIIPISLYYNFHNAIKYIMLFVLSVVLIVSCSKIILLLRKKVAGNYF